MDEPFRMNAVATSFFGSNALALLPPELDKRGLRRVLIVTDKFLFDSGAAEKVTHCLDQTAVAYGIYNGVQPNPTLSVVNDCLKFALQMHADCLLALGGGSAIDTSKAVGILCANGGSAEQYKGINKSLKPSIPIVAVNTTAGTGSEVTAFYIVTNNQTHSKMVMVDTNCMVSIAVNDTDLMLSMPKGLTASTGMDAMTHGIEALLSRRATPLTDKDAVWAIRTIREFLPRAVKDGGDVEARNQMAYAEYTAGMAFSNGGLGMVHAMAHALGGFYNLPHGVCNAVLLPYVMQYNGKNQAILPRFRVLADALGIRNAQFGSSPQLVRQSVELIRNMSSSFGIPEKLRLLKKVNPSDFSQLADLALKDTCMLDNPVQPSKEDVICVYQQAF